MNLTPSQYNILCRTITDLIQEKVPIRVKQVLDACGGLNISDDVSQITIQYSIIVPLKQIVKQTISPNSTI